MNLTKKTIFFISGFIFSVLFFGLAGGVQAQTACPSATTPGLLLCEDFEDNSWSDSFDGTFNPENGSIVSFSSAQSGSRVARMYGGYLGAAFDYNVSVSEGDEFYIKYYVYYPADWTWSGISDTNMKQFRAQGSNGYPIFVYQKDGAGGVRTFGGFSGYAGSGVCSDPTWYGPASTPSLSSWHKVEMFVRYASSGGGYWWKVDDNYVSQYNGTLDCDTFPSAEGAINNLRIAGGNGFPEGDFYYVDNMEIWDRLPSSSGTQTCSNCCTSSQTCPTAFTTVGTCTRCCSTACQTALTDTTAPRVTACTITPTTLTVGASITANYTVTDNTALARAELWRAPSGTNCTDTVKTGCVWTQVTSANITGTSRTGTFTSAPTAAGTFYYGLHAVDSAGNVGYESAAVRVIVNAATQTCTNCCTSTQTCPTAFTTVGSCTRCCATACQTAPQAGTLPIFPGATGWGTYTRAAYGGGSNPTVYRVTNLNASGSGSLEACVAASGPRVCIFETSGVIRITSNLAIRNPYITIAGQTAPNPGIMIRGAALTVLTHDVLVQHIRVRSGDADDGPDKSNRDSLQIDNNTGQLYNVVIDHCSFSWSVDENASVWHENIYNVSVINSIFSEALYLAGHPENPPDVPHSMGFIIGEGIDRTTVAYTLLAHNNQRNIRLSDNSSAEQINTLVYNYGTRGVDTEGNINVIGNQFIPGTNTDTDSSIYLRISAARVYTRDNINAPAGNASSPVATLGIPDSCILPSSAVLNYVLNYAGARPANRDTVDTRIINEVRNRTGSFKNTVAEAGGWPVLAQNTRALTTPANPHADSDGDGYTNLEEWLHQYSSQVEGGLVSACQTASGDTIAPVVSAFSITPTT